jgi:DNA-binding transcriptional ArsR family regulator
VDEEQASLLFHALADATRRDILVHALHQEQSVSGLARRYPVSVTAVQKHVAVLEKAGLVHKQRRGREQVVRVEITGLQQASALLDRYEQMWRARVQQMDDILSEEGHGHERHQR